MEGSQGGKKSRSRERILASAGSLLREKGISGTSVSEVMEGAGMTVGGFYAHFPSKQELAAAAMSETMSQSRGNLETAAEGKRGEEWLKAAARLYLSPYHRDHPEAGCPLPATLGEAAREEGAVREALAREIEETVAVIASHLEEAGAEDPEGEALAFLSAMVGGLALARALRGSPLSDDALEACRRLVERHVS